MQEEFGNLCLNGGGASKDDFLAKFDRRLSQILEALPKTFNQPPEWNLQPDQEQSYGGPSIGSQNPQISDFKMGCKLRGLEPPKGP